MPQPQPPFISVLVCMGVCGCGCTDVSARVCVLGAAIVNKYAYHKMRTTKSDYVRNCAPHEGHAQYLHKGENLNAAGWSWKCPMPTVPPICITCIYSVYKLGYVILYFTLLQFWYVQKKSRRYFHTKSGRGESLKHK